MSEHIIKGELHNHSQTTCTYVWR